MEFEELCDCASCDFFFWLFRDLDGVDLLGSPIKFDSWKNKSLQLRMVNEGLRTDFLSKKTWNDRTNDITTT